MKDYFFPQHKAVLMSRNPDQAWKYVYITRYDSQLVPFLFLQNNDCINIFVFQKRKWLFLSDDLRR